MQFSNRSIWTKLFVLSLIVMVVQSLVLPTPLSIFSDQAAFAVQDGEQAGDGGEAAAATGNATTAPMIKQTSMLGWLVNALGVLYIIVFLGLSFVLVALFFMNLLSARRDVVCPQSLIDGFEALLDEKKYQEAYEFAKADESFLGNVLSSGLAKLSSGYDHAVEAMQEVGQEETMKMQHRLSYLALIGTISPMIGLFGTVDGMIRSFFEIASAGGGSPDPNKLADGISKALVTTLIGLAIAIPAIAAYNILRNRYEQLELEVGINSGNLMGRFEKLPARKSDSVAQA